MHAARTAAAESRIPIRNLANAEGFEPSTFGSGGVESAQSSREVTGVNSPTVGELSAVAREVVEAVAGGTLPDALRARLAGVALLVGVDAAEVAKLLGGGPHAVAVTLRVAGQLLLLAAGEGAELVG